MSESVADINIDVHPVRSVEQNPLVDKSLWLFNACCASQKVVIDLKLDQLFLVLDRLDLREIWEVIRVLQERKVGIAL